MGAGNGSGVDSVQRGPSSYGRAGKPIVKERCMQAHRRRQCEIAKAAGWWALIVARPVVIVSIAATSIGQAAVAPVLAMAIAVVFACILRRLWRRRDGDQNYVPAA